MEVHTWPAAPDLALIPVCATFATLGHLLLTSAWRKAPASTFVPVNDIHIAFATLLGGLVLRHLPDALGFTGMAGSPPRGCWRPCGPAGS